MEIKLQRITIRQLVEGFTNNDEEGATEYPPEVPAGVYL